MPDFNQLCDDWAGLIHAAANRMAIPGRLDHDDLCQEAQMLLWEMVEEGDYPTDSSDFSKLYKTRLWHRMTDLVRRERTEGRDYRREIHADSNGFHAGRGDANVGSYWESNRETPGLFDRSTGEDPAAVVEAEDSLRHLRAALAKPTDRVLLSELLQPSEELQELHRAYLAAKGWQSGPIPIHLYGQACGLTYKQARGAMARIRQAAVTAFGRNDLVASA